MKKHVDVEHTILIKTYVAKQTNYPLSDSMDHELIKKITFINNCKFWVFCNF